MSYLDACLWPKNTILLTGDSMINGINEKRFSINFELVKVRFFTGTMIDYMYFNLIPLLRKNTATLILHVGTNNSLNETFQIYNKLLNLVHFNKENNLNCHVVLPSPVNRLDNGKVALNIERLNGLLLDSSFSNINNSNIGHSFELWVWTAFEPP